MFNDGLEIFGVFFLGSEGQMQNLRRVNKLVEEEPLSNEATFKPFLYHFQPLHMDDLTIRLCLHSHNPLQIMLQNFIPEKIFGFGVLSPSTLMHLHFICSGLFSSSSPGPFQVREMFYMHHRRKGKAC